jgi:hypothetical protein
MCRETFESRLHSDPRVVVLGKFNVTGVDVSLTGMCPGDTRVLRVPAALGYGGTAHTDPAVPANTEINYEITLVHLFRTHDTAFNLTAAIGQCRPGETFQYAHGGCTECAAGQFMAEAGSAGHEMPGCYSCATGKVSPDGARGCIADTDKYGRYDTPIGNASAWHRCVFFSPSPPSHARAHSQSILTHARPTGGRS